jgi:hypothetical protein
MSVGIEYLRKIAESKEERVNRQAEAAIKAGATGLAAGGIAPGLILSPALASVSKNQGKEVSDKTFEQAKKLRHGMGMGGKISHTYNDGLAAAGGGGAAGRSDMLYGNVKGKKKYSIGLSSAQKGGKLSNKELNVLSHEIGHTKNMERMGKKGIARYMKIRGAARSMALPGAFIGAGLGATGDGEHNVRDAIGVGASSLPAGVQLAEEATASARGLKGMAKYHGGGAKGLAKALFKGKAGGLRAHGMSMLSYGGLAAIPSLSYLAGRKFSKKKEK